MELEKFILQLKLLAADAMLMDGPAADKVDALAEAMEADTDLMELAGWFLEAYQALDGED